MPARAHRAIALLLVGIAFLPGCVVAIGNSAKEGPRTAYAGGGASRIHLTGDERCSLPVVETTADLPTVRSRHAAQIARLTPTTTVQQFRELFPNATFVERRTGADTFDAYSVRLEEKCRYRRESYGYIARDEKWFFFKNAVFVKWGERGDWPG